MKFYKIINLDYKTEYFGAKGILLSIHPALSSILNMAAGEKTFTAHTYILEVCIFTSKLVIILKPIKIISISKIH